MSSDKEKPVEERWSRAVSSDIGGVVSQAVADATSTTKFQKALSFGGVVAALLAGSAAMYGATIGAKFTSEAEKQNTEMRRLEVVESFIPHLTEGGEKAATAVILIKRLADEKTAIEIAELFPSLKVTTALRESGVETADILAVAKTAVEANETSFAIGPSRIEAEEFQATVLRAETQTREYAVTRYVPEEVDFEYQVTVMDTVKRTRKKEVTGEDGQPKIVEEEYTVEIPRTETKTGIRTIMRPYTEMKTQEYAVQVPQTETRERVREIFDLLTVTNQIRNAASLPDATFESVTNSVRITEGIEKIDEQKLRRLVEILCHLRDGELVFDEQMAEILPKEVAVPIE